MRKIVILLTGMVFILGVMVPMSHAQLKKEKQSPLNPIPKQDTVHIGVDKKDAPAAKTDQKAPAAPDQKAVAADQPAPADTKAQANKKTKKTKKSKKTKPAPKE